MLSIGLTGGIASGKSTVAKLFAEQGVAIVDTDELSRELVVPGSPALAEIVSRFGPEVLARDGSLDRPRLRRLVFSDPGRRRALEAILHPKIRETALARAAASPGPYVIIAVPLLLETGFDALVDRVLVVDCPETLQLERLTARDGASVDEARAMLAAQIGRESRLAAADDIIDNSGSLESTRMQVLALHERYLRLGQNCSSP